MEQLKTTSTLFKFMSIRPPTEIERKVESSVIQMETETVDKLLEISNGTDSADKKASNFNAVIKAFVDGSNYLASEADLIKLIQPAQNAKAKSNIKENVIETLYDNIVVKTLINSANSKLFKQISDSLIDLAIRPTDGGDSRATKVEIRMPKGLISIARPRPVSNTKTPSPKPNLELANQYSELAQQRDELMSRPVQVDVNLRVSKADTAEQATRVIESQMETRNAQIEQIERSMSDLETQLILAQEPQRMIRIGDRFHDIASFERAVSSTETGDQPDPSYFEQCDLIFPLAIADLRVVEQEVVGYLPGEIAHINCTEKGSYKERTTTRTLKTDTFESLMTENEVFSERDSQTTERFSLEKEASDTQNEETSVNVNASVSGSYGPVKAEVSGGYSNTQGSTSSQSNAQSYSKETVEKAIERVSSKVRKERSSRTIEEFIELNSAKVDLSTAKDHSVAIYRWLSKVVKTTLKNYGKRLIVEIGVPHPSHYFLMQQIGSQKSVVQPVDPRTDPIFPLTPKNITRDNFLNWATKYNTKLEHPPEERLTVSEFEAKGKSIPIPTGYYADKVHVNACLFANNDKWGDLIVLVGQAQQSIWLSPSTDGSAIRVATSNLNRETGQLPISFMYGGNRLGLTVEVECVLTEDSFTSWQAKCYFALIEAYENLKVEAENRMSEFDPALPGLHPSKKLDVVKTELKKACFQALHRCRPYWANDLFKVGDEYVSQCCYDHKQSQRVKFLEGLFDFDNMSYELHDYYWANKGDWQALLELTDDDPHFEKFLQASYATVRVPVHRNHAKEIAALNLIANGSIENYITQVPELIDFIAELEPENEKTKFTFDINNEPLDTPIETVDLGYYQLPTTLVILEQDGNGIEINGFPNLEDQFFSPAIIQGNGKKSE